VFSSGNYRAGYEWLRGGIGAGNTVHHALPQKFSDYFLGKGINVHVPLWLQEVPAKLHNQLSHAYNAAWDLWVNSDAGRNATTTEVLNKARELMERVFGIAASF